MPELEGRALARADLLGIVDYISDDNPDAAQRGESRKTARFS